MIIWKSLNSVEKKQVLKRPALEQDDLLQKQVAEIIEAVRLRGDVAVSEFTKRFDGVEVDDPWVSPMEIDSAITGLDSKIKVAIDIAYSQIKAFHTAQIQPEPEVIETTVGVKCTLRVQAMEAVGLYVPGGATPLPSTALMLGVPAQLAGCPRTIMVTPPNQQGGIAPEILYAAFKCGITDIY